MSEAFISARRFVVFVAVPSKAQVRAAYARIADPFAASREEPWPEVMAFAARLPAESRILDLGCGNGRHARILASQGHPVVAVDFTRRLLLLGRRGTRGRWWAENVAWLEGEVAALPLQAQSIDACVCVALLHHLPTREDRLATLREIRRVLVPGGSTVLSVWALDQPRFREFAVSRQSLPAEVRGDVEVPWTMPDGSVVPRYYHLFQPGELESLVIESGLHGERYFRAAGNYFAEARVHG